MLSETNFRCNCGTLWTINSENGLKTRFCPVCKKKQIFLRDPKDKYTGIWIKK